MTQTTDLISSDKLLARLQEIEHVERELERGTLYYDRGREHAYAIELVSDLREIVNDLLEDVRIDLASSARDLPQPAGVVDADSADLKW